MKALWRAWTWLCAVAGHVGAIRVEVDWHRAALDERLCDGAIRALYAAATAKVARPKGPCGDHRRRGVKFDPGGLPHFHGEMSAVASRFAKQNRIPDYSLSMRMFRYMTL